jgi:2-dehydro-3-deoxyphosphogluconate aldolase/(4S)-4-hydroxy-2-oxoglutarate aldolase
MRDVVELLRGNPVIPVLAFQTLDEAREVSGRLVEDGMLVLEITLRTEVALDCIRAVADEFPGAIVGAGTILNPDQALAARDAGAKFGVSPGLTPDLSRAVDEMDWPFLPGIATISEAMAARDAGFGALKFFPSEASGGRAFLKSAGAVLPELMFCPTGGITAANADAYLALDNVFAVGGSWLQK